MFSLFFSLIFPYFLIISHNENQFLQYLLEKANTFFPFISLQIDRKDKIAYTTIKRVSLRQPNAEIRMLERNFMPLTETKKKYLLTIALLNAAPAAPFRPIDLAVKLGVSRASVSRMLFEFIKEGLVVQKEHSYQLSQQGLKIIADSLHHYHQYYAFYAQTLGLNKYDAHECCISMLCSLNQQTIEHLSNQLSNHLKQKAA